MVPEIVTGTHCTLHRAHFDEALEAHFKDPRLQGACGISGDRARGDGLAELLDEARDNSLFLYRVQHPPGIDTGYSGIVLYDGPPYFIFYTFDRSCPLEAFEECLIQAIPAFFETSKEPYLWFFPENDVAEALSDVLATHGFELVEDCPIIDSKRQTAFVLERDTYDVYFGNADEGEP